MVVGFDDADLRYGMCPGMTAVCQDAVRRAGRAARLVRRSIALTPFGHDFCAVCLPTGPT